MKKQSDRVVTERRDDQLLLEFQCGSHDSMSEFSEVVFVAMADLFDQAMGTKAFEQVRRLR